MNKHKKKLLCIISFAVVVSISFVSTKSVRADENFRVAKIKNFSGKVKIGKGGGEKPFDAIEGMSLVEGDSITTEKDSSVLLYIDDDKEVKIGDNSIVNLSELSGYIDSDDQKTGISLWVGKIFSNIKKKLKIRSKYEIKVPTAVMGVRGTEFSVESLADGEIKVIVLEGTVTAVRTVVNDSEKYTTFEVTITKDQSASMNQKDESQNDITITGIKVNEASQFVLEILKDFIERNPESLDENSKKEIYDEIEKRKAEKLAMEESPNDLYEIEKPSIKIDPIVEESMSLNNVMTSADLENQNMQPPNVLPEGAQGNQLSQANLFNAPAGQDRPAPPQPVIPSTQQIMSTPAPTQAISGQSVPVPPVTESVPPQPIQGEQKPSSQNGGGTTNSNETNVNPPVNSVNIAPSAQNSSIETSYSTMTSGRIIASDANGDSLIYSLITASKHGTARVNSSTGAWEYTPEQQFTGTDSFVVTVSDGKGGSASSTVTVIVMANLNPMPVAQDGNLNINQYIPTNGQLIATNVNANETLTYTVTSNPLHGTVILSVNGSYTYTPYPNYHGVDSFKFKVNNGSVDSNEATVSINVMSVNNVPTAGNYNVQTDYNTIATGTITASDADGDTLSYSVTTGAAVHGTVSIDSSTGQWEYIPAQQFSGIDSFVVIVSDGKGGSATSTVTVTVKPEVIVPPPPNTAPVAQDGSITTLEDTTATGQLTATDADANTTLTYIVTSNPSHGTVVLNGNGSYGYTPNSDYNGSDSFRFKANDGTVDSNEATVSITVTSVNDSPIVANYNVQTDYNTIATGTITASDADGDTLSYSVTTGAAVHGTVSIDSSTGQWEYIPAQQFSGIDSFVVIMSDVKGGSATSTVTVTVKPEVIVPPPPNTAPVAQDGSITTLEDTTATGQLTATDADANTTLTYAITSNPAHGTVMLNGNGSYSYTPNSDYNGSDSFRFKANDGTVDSNEATVSITVTSVNDSPIVANYNVQTDYNTIATGTITASDGDGDTLSYSVTTGAAVHGTVVIDSSTGEWEYTPAQQFSGIDSFVVTVSDGKGGSTTSTVTVTVKTEVIVPPPPNTAPVAQDGSITTLEDTTATGQLTATDADANTTLTYAITSNPAHGTVVLNGNGSYGYTPNSDYNGSDSFRFKANDGTVDSNEATVSITVTSVNDSPIVANYNVQTDYNTIATGTITASDADGDTLSYSVTTGAAVHGTVSIDSSTGQWEYIPAQQFSGIDSFVVIVSDGKGGSATSTVTVTVKPEVIVPPPPNTAPVAQDGSITTLEDTTATGQLAATDADANTTLTYIVTSNPDHGTVVLNGNGSYGYTPNSDYNGSDSFKFKANDGTADSNEATVNITVTPVNDSPIVQNYNVQTDYNTMATGTISASDPDGDTLSYSVTTGAAAHGTVTVDSTTGQWEYIPAQQFSGIDTFVVTVSDGKGGSATSTVTVTVKPEVIVPPPPNTALTAEDMGITTLEDTEASGQLTAVNGGNAILSYLLTSYPTNGEAIIDSNGSYRYMPNADYNGSDSFKFKVNNGTVDSNEATVTITVTPVNDSPIVSDYNIQTNYSTMATGAISASDPDGDTLSYEVTTGAAVYGTVVIDPSTGEWEYTPAQQFSGIDSFVVTVSDGNGGSATSTVTVTVKPEAPPNTAPIAQDGSITTSEDTTANGQLTATDVDTNATLTYIVTSDPTHGTVTVNSDGTYSYTPDANYIGNDSFKFKANDGALDSNEVTMSITVIANLQSLKSTLNTKITDAQGWASTQVGSGVAECSSQAAIDQLNSAITSAQYIMSQNDATADEINGAITSLQNSVEQVKNNIVNTLMVFTASGDGSVTANSSFDEVIEVEPNIGYFFSSLSSGDIILGGDFKDLTIKSVSVSSINNYKSAMLELSGNLSKNTGAGTITIKAAGWESTVNSKDITAEVVVKPEITGPVNHPPIAQNGSITTPQNIPISAGHVTATDDDLNPITYELVNIPSHGSITFNSDGTYSYTPGLNYIGPDSFTFKANDGTADSNEATIYITVSMP